MEFNYKINKPITAGQFISLLKRSTLGEIVYMSAYNLEAFSDTPYFDILIKELNLEK